MFYGAQQVNDKSDLFGFDHCRQSKAEVRTAAAKVDGMTKMMQNIQEQMQRRVSDGISTQSCIKDVVG